LIHNDNTGSDEALIYGEFDNKILRTNAEFQVFNNSTGSSGHIELTETSSADGARIMFQHETETDNKWTLWGRADDTPADGQFNFHYTDTGNILTITGTGQVGIRDDSPTFALELPNNSTQSIGKARANSWDTYSDSRIKENQRNIKYGLKELLQITPKSYTQYNSSFQNGKLVLDKSLPQEEIGFIAQELYEIIPEAVSKPENEQNDLWSINYEKIIPITVESVKELSEKINNLEQENKLLKERLDKLEVLLSK